MATRSPSRRKPANTGRAVELGGRVAARSEPANEIHESVTALAGQALERGTFEIGGGRRRPVSRQRGPEAILAGDVDDDAMANAYVGDETPGGSASTPDQNNVDDIGRAYGLQEEDAGGLRSVSEVLTRRDLHRQELLPPRRRRL